MARFCLRLLRAAIPAYLGTIWETLAKCWVEAAQCGATVTELRQMEHYVLEVTNRPPSRREEELLAAAQVEVIKWYPERIVEEVVMGKYKRMLIAEGLQEGLQEGRQEGLQVGLQAGEAIVIRKGEVIGIEVGQRRLIQRLLESRFGPLLDWALERLTQSTQADRHRWTDRLFTVAELVEILAEE